MKYFDELKRSMDYLARDPRVMFLGQAVACPGTAMTNTLKDVPDSRKLELPVCEELQMGMSTGLALAGLVPVSVFPRWNFLLLATATGAMTIAASRDLVTLLVALEVVSLPAFAMVGLRRGDRRGRARAARGAV